ncbi:glycosyltransferase [Acetobacter sp. TBRC 12305]|uniref:Glycosyltransferase family 2 protein n=1 Tax=Acetobacter garciniae TaxID=2817435 RepID=A0A939HN43_9PROT|nr:glycosyltransferase family 2 protein [Acetobacter garciniae]MBO1323974.1 glycosyltransferase family 2 protein [Acetobacter garciniae]MBX0343663.1 glycosyltransferase [Acetobacter garciniae]
MSELVSIVIPTFNRAAMLPRAIESALAQTVSCEVIVIDHGSTDETQHVAAAYKDRITYIRREKDLGPHFCWLEGVLHSKGDLVHLQYDDDWIAPQFVEACLGVMREDVGFAFTVAHVVEAVGAAPKLELFGNWLPKTGIYPAVDLENRILNGLISPAAALFRRQILIDALYQGRLPLANHDYHGVGPDCFVTLLSMLRYPNVGFVHEALAFFYSHPGSITIDAQGSPEKQAALTAAYAEVKRYYIELKILQAIRAQKTA